MTGYGAADGSVAGGRFGVEIRTVNHRYFNLSLKVPSDFAPLEGDLRELLRREFERGHVSVSLRWTESAGRMMAPQLNLERAYEVLDVLRRLQTELGLPGQIDVSMLARQPEVITNAATEPEPPAWDAVAPVVQEAARACNEMRVREGDVLAGELKYRLDLLEAGLETVRALAPARLVRERDRLHRSVASLLEGAAPDPDRLAQEIALLADRLDITEELVRFAAHIAAARRALGAGGPAGKQLGFLAQELGREVNTIGSKANDAEITRQVVQMKGELEKFREQLENLE